MNPSREQYVQVLVAKRTSVRINTGLNLITIEKVVRINNPNKIQSAAPPLWVWSFREMMAAVGVDRERTVLPSWDCWILLLLDEKDMALVS